MSGNIRSVYVLKDSLKATYLKHGTSGSYAKETGSIKEARIFSRTQAAVLAAKHLGGRPGRWSVYELVVTEEIPWGPA